MAHGDYIAAGLPPGEVDDEERSAEYRDLIEECKSSRKDREGWKDRIRGIRCDGRSMSNTQSAIAEAIKAYGRIDILLCNTSEGTSCSVERSGGLHVAAVIGSVEELSTSPSMLDLAQRQFQIIFFSHVNFIKAILPILRAKHNGHIIILTSIGGHIGTPGMPMFAAATWALEGYCDSLAYEIAPFNIKLTIVQPSKEINVLTNKIIFAPQLPQYESQNNPAPGMRDMLWNVLNTNPATRLDDEEEREPRKIIHRYTNLPAEARDKLVMETVHALTAIGGHENPPARHVVGYEGILAVKEKLKTVSEELEDFVEVSMSVDIIKGEQAAATPILGT